MGASKSVKVFLAAGLAVWALGAAPGSVRQAQAYTDYYQTGVATCNDCHVGQGYGFHRGGVARCNGCHTMHNSQNGTLMTYNRGGSVGSSFPSLLRASDPTSVCLYCHHNNAGHRDERIDIIVSTFPTPANLTPGGDFGWLKKNYAWSGGASPGAAHGHNVVGQDFGYTADPRFTEGPGGAYPAATLSCVSCHDPHGRYRRLGDGSEIPEGVRIRSSGSSGQAPGSYAVGSYRLLAGAGYATSQAPEHAFVHRTPVAVLPSYPVNEDWDTGSTWRDTVNRSEAVSDTRVGYGTGMAEWCANCHAAIHNPSYPANLRHPAGSTAQLGSAIAANYNAYVKTGDLSGSEAASFTSLVPFETGQTDLALLQSLATSSTAGPQADANVSCLTCHRAHASGWDSIGRWNFQTTFVTYAGNWPGTDGGDPEETHQGRTRAETRLAYYDRPPTRFATYQRSLCNKCHVKD
ncbi:MAG: hypothetical protein SCH98_18040 [Deferrisomatales bacterium]|nr:hypothetical protein [Deferrisomatales bacterium]